MAKETVKKVARVVLPGYKVAEKVVAHPAVRRAIARAIEGMQTRRPATNRRTISKPIPKPIKPNIPVTRKAGGGGGGTKAGGAGGGTKPELR